MDISTSPPLFFTGQKVEILPCFSTPLAFQVLVKNGVKNQKSKAVVPMSALSSATDPVQLGPSSSWDPFAKFGPIKCDNWKNGYIALTQLHVDRLHSNFTIGSKKAAKLSKPTKGQIQDCGRHQIFNIQTMTSMERLKLETSNLQKLGQRGRD